MSDPWAFVGLSGFLRYPSCFRSWWLGFKVEFVLPFICLVEYLSPIFFGTSFLFLWVHMGTLLPVVVGGPVAGIYHVGRFAELSVIHM